MNWVLTIWLVFAFLFMMFKLFVTAYRGSEHADLITLGALGSYLLVATILFVRNERRKVKRDYVREKIEFLRCKTLTKQRNENVYNWTQNVAEDYRITNLELYVSDVIKNNAFSVSGRNRNIIVVSANVIDNFSFSAIKLILTHEFYHLKYFTANKFEYLVTQPEFDHRKTLFFLLLIPLFVSTIISDYFSASSSTGSILLLEGEEVDMFLRMFAGDGLSYIILVLIYATIIDAILTFSRRSAKMYSSQLSELLSDAFSVLESREFREYHTLIKSMSSSGHPGGSYALPDIQECFGPERRVRAQAARVGSKLFSIPTLRRNKENNLGGSNNLDDKFKNERSNNWVDIIHKYRDPVSKYDTEVRLEFIDDLRKMCEERVSVVTLGSKFGPFKVAEYDELGGDLDTISIFTYILGVHRAPPKLLDSVMKYIASHRDDFNLRECAKTVGQTDFVVLLAFLKHLLHRNIVLEWRYPIRFRFDY